MATGSQQEKFKPFPFIQTQLSELGIDSGGVIPSISQESWKYTNLSQLANIDFQNSPDICQLTQTDLSSLANLEPKKHDIYIVDGKIMNSSSITSMNSSKLEISLGNSFQSDYQKTNSLLFINQNLKSDSIDIKVLPNTVIDTPIRLIFLTNGKNEPVASHPCVNFTAGVGCNVILLEHHISSSNAVHWTNSLIKISVESGARLAHYRLQENNTLAWNTCFTEVSLNSEANYENFCMINGANLSRNEIHVKLTGEYASCSLNGAHMVRNKQSADTTTVISHDAPNCSSRQLYRCILDDSARSVLQGKVKVLRDAQKTDGEQMFRSILLSPNSQTFTKPELEIYADDVKCSHGATAGDLDEEQLFYLRSRGMSYIEARNLLIEGFMTEHFDLIDDLESRKLITNAFKSWLSGTIKGHAL